MINAEICKSIEVSPDKCVDLETNRTFVKKIRFKTNFVLIYQRASILVVAYSKISQLIYS